MKKNRICFGIALTLLVLVTVAGSVSQEQPAGQVVLGAVDFPVCVSFHPLTSDYILMKSAIEGARGGIVRILVSESELRLRDLEVRLGVVEADLDRLRDAAAGSLTAGGTAGGTGEIDTSAHPEVIEAPVMVSIDIPDEPVEENEEQGGKPPLDEDALVSERYLLLEQVEKAKAEIKYIPVDEAQKRLDAMAVTIKKDILNAVRAVCRERGIDLAVNYGHSSLNYGRRVFPYPDRVRAVPHRDTGPKHERREDKESSPAPLAVEVTEQPMLHYSEVFWTEENRSQLRALLARELKRLPFFLKLFSNHIGTRQFMWGRDRARYKDVFVTGEVIKKVLNDYKVEADKVEATLQLVSRLFDPGSAGDQPAEYETEAEQ